MAIPHPATRVHLLTLTALCPSLVSGERGTEAAQKGNSYTLKIQRLNWLTRGWCEYYRSTSSPPQMFRKLNYELFWDFAHWLGRKYESNMPAIMRRFRKGNTFGNGTITLIMPSEYQAKRFL